MSPIEQALRMLLAILLGSIVGYERQTEDRAHPAGMKALALTTLGSCLFMIVSLTIAEVDQRADATRIAAQVVTGIGFLGAGVILQKGSDIRGLTTAGSIWVCAAIGLAVGGGLYGAATFATALTYLALRIIPGVHR